MRFLRPPFRSFNVLALALAFAGTALADAVDTRDGTHIVGKITRIDAGAITVETAAAGKISIKQAEVTAISTDQPVAVRLSSGTRIDGRIVPVAGQAAGGALQVAGTAETVTTTVTQLAASWPAGQVDPEYDRRWAYEASVDVSGRNGNSEQLGTAGDFRATLRSVRDTLLFYAAYNRQVTDGTKSADQMKIGIDYQNNFRGQSAWYIRDEGGFDRVRDIELYNVAAAGYGFDVIKEPHRTLTGRLGLAFRYEGYRNPASTDVKSLGVDVGVNSDLEFGNSKLVTRISFVPLLDDFGNYRLTHDSYYQIPLANPAWKLRLGVANDYNSRPPPQVEKLDTTYFTRLVLSWR